VAGADRLFVPRLGVLTQLVFAVLLGGLSSLVATQDPDFVSRPLVLFGVYALPAVVGYLAIRHRRPGTLLGAGLASALGSFLAFSGVTLIFLVPAVLLLVGAGALRGGRSSWGSIAFGVAQTILVAVLLATAGLSALLVTDERCWTWHATPDGDVTMQPAPIPTGEMTAPIDTAGSGFGCSNGVISARGVVLGFGLGLGAVGFAGYPFARRRTPLR
jgi:hypothetical protein